MLEDRKELERDVGKQKGNLLEWCIPWTVMMMRSILCFILLLHLCVGCATFCGCQKSNPFAAAATTPTDEESLTEPRPLPSSSCLGSEANCRIEPLKIRFGREKHPWHDEEAEEEAEEDGEEQEDDYDDDDEAAAEHERCGAALLQGLRPSQEDRILCVPDIPLPTFGKSFLFLVQEGFAFTQNLKFEALLSFFSLFLSFVLYMGWQQQWQPREGTHLTGRILLLKNQGATNMMYLR
jgi:hypothetical protein